MTCKISTLDKKSIGCTEFFVKTIDGVQYSAELEIWWRWGYVIVEENASDIDAENPEGLVVTDLCIEDQDLSDGVACYWNFSSNMTDEMKAEVEQLWDDEGYGALEEAGWDLAETETVFHGPLEVEDLGDTVKEEAPKGTWPF